jgi:molybdate transport system regulatory protein
MSYRRAWVLVDTMNRCFKEPLVSTATGGDRGGGARVTPFGREVLARFRAMQAKADGAIAADMAAFGKLLA